MPSIPSLVRFALPRVVESSLIPLALFYVALSSLGQSAGLLAALAWSYAALLRRLVTGRAVPGLLVLGTIGLTARTAVAFATQSLFVYFLQPTVTTVAMAVAFAVSVPAGRPLAQRVATDVIPLSPDLLAEPGVRKVFNRVSLLWAGLNLANAGITVWLLLSQPLADYPAMKTVSSNILVVGGLTLSVVWLRAALRRTEPISVPAAVLPCAA